MNDNTNQKEEEHLNQQTKEELKHPSNEDNQTSSFNIKNNQNSFNQPNKIDPIIDSKEKPMITKNDQRISTNYDFLFKVSLIGDSGTGKTSVLIRLTENTFKENTSSTIGVDFKILSVKYHSKLAKIQIWDTCGSERFKSLTTSFIKTCAVFILVFDLTNRKSFENLSYWLNLILDNTSPKVMCLVGNKSDLIDETNKNLVDPELISSFCDKYGMKYIQTSAKENTNIEDMFQHISVSLFNEAEKSLVKKEAEKLEAEGKSIVFTTEEDKKGKNDKNDNTNKNDSKKSSFSIKGFFKKRKEKVSNCCSKNN